MFFVYDFLKRYSITKFLIYSAYFTIAVLGAYFIVQDVNWCFGDDYEFLLSTAIGKIEPLSRHSADGGRFIPLQHYDFNLLTLFSFGKTALAHYLWIALSFMILVYFWVRTSMLICKRGTRLYKTKLAISLICFIMLICNFCTILVFQELIYPERFILVLLMIFIYLSFLHWKNEILKYVLAFMLAIYLSYMKEPMSGALCVFALTNLIFLYKKLSWPEKLFYMGLVLNFIVYLILYYFLVYQTTLNFYNQGGRNTLSYLDNIYSIFYKQKLLFILFVFGMIRGIKILFFKDLNHLKMDSLLFMTMAYTGAFFVLKLNATYYFLPSILIGTVVIFYWICEYLLINKIYSTALLSVCVWFIFFGYNLSLIQYKIRKQEYQIFIPAISSIITKYGTDFKMYGKNAGNFNDQVFNWHRVVLNTAINYLLKTENENYVSRIDDANDFSANGVNIVSDFSNMTPDENKKLRQLILNSKSLKIFQRWGLSFFVKENR